MPKKKVSNENSARLFGTDGVRGLANVSPMSVDKVIRLGQAIGLYFRAHYDKPRIVIGKDTRRSGYMLEQALSAGICSVGVDTYFLGPLPTPGIAYMTRGIRANAGIVISASHNPYEDNGIKIFSADGYKLPDQVEDELEQLVADPNLSQNLPTGKGLGTTKRIEDASGQYAVFLKEQFPKHLTLDGLRIVIDAAHGAGYKVAPKVFEELGAEVFLHGASPNGTNINDMVGALYPEALADKVKLYKADLGIALDGDADRLIVVDDKGHVLDGDEILAICGIHYLEHHRLQGNRLVCTVMSNMGLERALLPYGGKLIRTQVGDRYVVEAMRQGGYNLGGEQSGHLIFHDSSTTGDGILAALCLIEILLEKQKPMSELRACMERVPQVTKSFVVPAKPQLSELPRLQAHLSQLEQELAAEGRVLFRYSGTEAKARIMIEGPYEDRIAEMAEDIVVTAQTSIRHHVSEEATCD
ncbi:MAG: phosphoglucosamine mutase [Zetaproteobacteria bacterium]|nr:phosphoglucosamine mutase [Zetaproteobacteria bacterium]